mmetsp:Transcript_97305/g.261423  ORF Transcript_97305/g.261423 Transcript_97305/m.261423 type:complete len:272 (+) Transcript_97305:492-1307(+)
MSSLQLQAHLLFLRVLVNLQSTSPGSKFCLLFSQLHILLPELIRDYLDPSLPFLLAWIRSFPLVHGCHGHLFQFLQILACHVCDWTLSYSGSLHGLAASHTFRGRIDLLGLRSLQLLDELTLDGVLQLQQCRVVGLCLQARPACQKSLLHLAQLLQAECPAVMRLNIFGLELDRPLGVLLGVGPALQLPPCDGAVKPQRGVARSQVRGLNIEREGLLEEAILEFVVGLFPELSRTVLCSVLSLGVRRGLALLRNFGFTHGSEQHSAGTLSR